MFYIIINWKHNPTELVGPFGTWDEAEAYSEKVANILALMDSVTETIDWFAIRSMFKTVSLTAPEDLTI